MKAAVCTGWGPPEVLHVTEVERPAPRKGEEPGNQVFGLSQWKAGCYAEYVCWSAGGPFR